MISILFPLIFITFHQQEMSRPDGGLVCMALKTLANGPERSIAAETRCPRDVRSYLNFRHNVAWARTTLRAMYGRRPRCKMNLAFCEASGAAMYPACFRVEACPVAMQPLWPLALM